MKYEDFMRIIERSEIEDWLMPEQGSYINREDLLITVREKKAAAGNVYFEWTQKYESPDATMADWELCYNGVPIERFETVRVDGGRMCIPLPDDNMQITDRQRRIGYILNAEKRTDFLRYLDIARITVREAYTQREAGGGYAYTS